MRPRGPGHFALVAVAAFTIAIPAAVQNEPPRASSSFWPPPVLSRERAIAETVRVDSAGGGARDTGTGIGVGAHVVLTNAHLTNDPVTSVTRCGDQVLPVNRIDRATDGSDIAVLTTGGPNLIPVELAAHDPKAGDAVVMVGYPKGVLTFTQGRVEGGDGTVLRFSPEPDVGQSGSALLDEDGRVAGLAFARDQTGGQGLAIPASRLRALVDGFRAVGVPIADPVTGDPSAAVARSSPCPST